MGEFAQVSRTGIGSSVTEPLQQQTPGTAVAARALEQAGQHALSPGLHRSARAQSLAQMKQMLDASPRVRSQAALQRVLDRTAAAAPPRHGRRPPLQAKIVYPIKTTDGLINNAPSLREHLLTKFGASSSEPMIDRYIADIERHSGTFGTIRDITDQVGTRVRYDIAGGNKWMEFIDEKDHAAALEATKRGDIKHPGHYYDYHWESGRAPQKRGDHFSAFMDADAYVSSRLNTKLSADEYFHIGALASQGISSDLLKGPRTKDVTWGLPPTTTERQLGELTEKGLEPASDKETQGWKVTAPMPQNGMKTRVQELLDRYYSVIALSNDSVTRVSAIVSLYQSLEALHPFKDATSRTNHLVLNKLLAENGLEPAVLHEPNSPTSSEDEFGRHIIEGIGYTREVAKRPIEATGPGSNRALAIRRNKRDQAIAEYEQLKSGFKKYKMKMDLDPAKERPTFVPKSDTFLPPFKVQIEHLMGGGEEREHVASTAAAGITEASFRNLLGDRRIDEYLAHKSKMKTGNR